MRLAWGCALACCACGPAVLQEAPPPVVVEPLQMLVLPDGHGRRADGGKFDRLHTEAPVVLEYVPRRHAKHSA